MRIRGNRWSDNDRNFGPFTFSWAGRKGYRPLALVLKSWGSGDDDAGPASLRISLVWFTFIIWLPPILFPQRRKIVAGWDAATVARLGRDWYWDVKVREYGFSYSDGFLQIHYGICPGDSSRDQTWSKHLPWTQWRHVRRSFYDLDGKHFWSELDAETENYRGLADRGRHDLYRERFDIVRKWEEMCPKATFRFRDHDGEGLTATTHIEEREWLFGTGWFKWLSWFRRPMIRRTLDINFSGETGPEKGSWKGGTVGTSIEMKRGELHEAAFRRYCDEEHRSKYRPYRITFLGRV
jgi:hypothetical protein